LPFVPYLGVSSGRHQVLGRDAEKNDLTECAEINDLIIMRGHETPENHPLTILKGLSTVSEAIADMIFL
jgi:hypothetical protein